MVSCAVMLKMVESSHEGETCAVPLASRSRKPVPLMRTCTPVQIRDASDPGDSGRVAASCRDEEEMCQIVSVRERGRLGAACVLRRGTKAGSCRLGPYVQHCVTGRG
ncbi:hypothetical protein AMAG_20569 [Allomyces macrogynus ATCC 38327]|uniref:Uncharacterized protein n=1 Tax=Allomyces macrogynus (strain ATCC 38327) TaxID=578462 RepID=A0A0L0TCC8_ALLM3|nr:hypothetical protein AMAG_20569 [Allomyces macrogynus ATCC 38327]|eukprot:KNE72370.1 hypothetical protein AMAG_20569 [Allomyces macrogynus ATCC 38327]